MLNWILVAAILILSVFDAAFTYRRVKKYGLHVELNASLIKLSVMLGGGCAGRSDHDNGACDCNFHFAGSAEPTHIPGNLPGNANSAL